MPSFPSLASSFPVRPWLGVLGVGLTSPKIANLRPLYIIVDESFGIASSANQSGDPVGVKIHVGNG